MTASLRVAFNGLFLRQPHTGSGQYSRLLLPALRTVAPDVAMLLLGEQRGAGLHRLAPVPTARGENVKKLTWEQAVVPALAAQRRADLLHVPYWAPPLVSSVPVVTTIHDVIPALLPEYRGGRAVRAYTWLVSRATRLARRIIVDSECSKRDLIRILDVPAERVDVVPLAAGPGFRPLHRPSARRRCARRWNLDAPFVLYAGGNDVRKNVSVLLRAWADAAPRLPTHWLVLAGNLTSRPPFFPDLRRLAEQLRLPRLHFLGPVSDEEKYLLLAACDVFAWPSRYEGFGLPPLEAMQSGAPVVCTDSSSMPEVVGDAAWLVPPDDVSRLAEGLVAVCSGPALRTTLRKAGVARAAAFTWEHTAELTVASFRRALEHS